MAKEKFSMKMVGLTKDSLKMSWNMGTEYILGRMGRSMMDSGLMASSMEKVSSLTQTMVLNLAYGKMVKEFNGWIKILKQTILSKTDVI